MQFSPDFYCRDLPSLLLFWLFILFYHMLLL